MARLSFPLCLFFLTNFLGCESETPENPIECQIADAVHSKDDLVGEWEVTKLLLSDGWHNYLPGHTRMIFYTKTLEYVDPRGTKTAKYFADSTVEPNKLDIAMVGGEPDKWIYSIEGDALKLCNQPDTRKPRPRSFDPDVENGEQLFLLKRVPTDRRQEGDDE